MTRRLAIWLPLATILALAGFLAVPLLRNDDPTLVATPLKGQSMPAIDLPAFDTARPHFSSVTLERKPRLINFFASWCGPCAVENDVLLMLGQTRGVEIDGIALKDTRAGLAAYFGKRKNPYSQLGLDESGRTSIDWGVTGVPETFAIDANGVIVDRHVGGLKPEDAKRLVDSIAGPGN